MSGSALVDNILAALSAMVLLLLLLLAVLRIANRLRERRRERLQAPLRRLLVELMCADEEEGAGETSARRTLSLLDERSWAELEPVGREMLGKVSGGAREMLVEVFEERGVADRALADLGGAGPVRRARAAEVLGMLRHRAAVPGLCRLLGDRDPEVRAVAARALGQIRDASAVPALLACLHGPHAVPATSVLRALTGCGSEAEEAIGAGLDDPDPLVRAVAIEALGTLGAVARAPRIAEALLDDPDAEVRIRAARAVGTLGMPSGVAPLLRVVEPGGPVALRTVAAGALGRIGDVRAVPRLQSLLGDPAPRLAATAAGALLRLGPQGRAALRGAAAGAEGERAAAQARAALAQAAVVEGGPESWAEASGS